VEPSHYFCGHLLAHCTSPGRQIVGTVARLVAVETDSEKTCPGTALSTADPTGIGSGSNPGRCGDKPATDRLSYGTVCCEFTKSLETKKACRWNRTLYLPATKTELQLLFRTHRQTLEKKSLRASTEDRFERIFSFITLEGTASTSPVEREANGCY
jgi:hypothetical protein